MQYMFGTNVISDWQEGSPILWKGEWQGKKYEDLGVILKLEPERVNIIELYRARIQLHNC
jgi:hypothetical protein